MGEVGEPIAAGIIIRAVAVQARIGHDIAHALPDAPEL
jgi:hypothetical protein